MRKTDLWRPLALACTALLATVPAWGYKLRTDESGIYVIKWHSSPVTMQFKLSGAPNLLDGDSQRGSVAQAMSAWNEQLGTVQLSPELAEDSSYAVGNGVSEIVMDSTLDGDAFPNGTLAVTISYSRSSNDYGECDIVFNTAYHWDSYRGSLRQGTEDIQRVAIHELGHVLGLLHPDEAGQFVTALMNSHTSHLDRLQNDDIAGARVLYGAPGVTAPGNDHFANATEIALASGTQTRAGSNLLANRESGEPSHATSTSVHSVWWRWTAPTAGAITLNTLGSNFDTVLAVYTGAAVSALTEVGSNDDEESPEQNPNDNRRRTSRVAFNVVAGTTYYIAVDGWGSAPSLESGYTGTISLSVNFAPLIAPVITSQPNNRTEEPGREVTFSVSNTGSSPLTHRWQRLPAGESVWSDLVASSVYTPVNSQTLRINPTTLAMDGDQFRCVVSNPAGTATSSAATLRVTVTPPAIISQTSSVNAYPGDTRNFGVSVTGRPAPTCRWQRLPVGGAWADLSDGGAYSSTGTSYMTVNVALAMNSDRFRCVATNIAGTAISNPATLTVVPYPLPVITRQPTGGTLFTGIAASLSVAATGATSYQWHRNGVALAGQTGTSFVLLDPQPADAGVYHVVVSNRGGPVASQNVTLGVIVLPVVTPQSALRQVLTPGESADFSVSATGDGPLTYQWYHRGQRIDGATTASYRRTVSGEADGGAYWIVVSDRQGTRHGAPFFVLVPHPQTHVIAWGADYSGQAQVGPGVTNAVALSAGWDYCLALKGDGTVTQWGYTSLPGLLPAGLNNVVAVAGGRVGSLALKSDGTLVGVGDFGTIPAGLRNVVAIAAGANFAVALKTDRTVLVWPVLTQPTGWTDIVAISMGGYHALGVKADGTVVTYGGPAVPAGLNSVVAVAGGMYHSLALKADGTVVAWGENGSGQINVPASLNNVVAIAAASYHSLALRADGTIVAWGENTYGNSSVPNGTGAAFFIAAGGHTSFALRDTIAGQPPAITSPLDTTAYLGGSPTLYASAMGNPPPTVQWQRNGANLAGETKTFLSFPNLQPADTGLYTAVASSGAVVTTSSPAIVGLAINAKVAGSGSEVGANIVHANGNVYDQVLLQGAAATIRADYGQVVRLSFVDFSKDIVQVEFSGAGTLSLVLDGQSGPTAPENYEQPGVSYMKGHAGIVITGADQSTNVSVFSVGRANAVNQAIFRSDVTYDGVADLAFIAIMSNNGRFGGLRAANTTFFATKGFTGIYAPRVQFTGPVFVGDIQASDAAEPVLRLGSAADVQINGGDLSQPNHRAVQVSGIAQLRFVAGTTSHGSTLAAQPNKGRLEQNGADVTTQIVINPSQ